MRDKTMKRYQLLASLTTLLSISVGGMVASTNVHAEPQKFFCGDSGGVPTTMASTSRGPIPVIRWVSNLGDGEYSPRARCQSVSERFQRYYDSGQLNYLTTGTENGTDIICVTAAPGGNCAGTLFTLKPGSNPNQTLKQLFGVQNSVGPLNEGISHNYIAMEDILQKRPVDDESPKVQESVPVPSADWGAETTENRFTIDSGSEW
jgi:hypothetical protein